MLCIRLRSFEFAISRRIRLSWSIFSPPTPSPWSFWIKESLNLKKNMVWLIFMLRALFLKIKMHRVAENFKVILWAIGWLSGPLHGYEWIDTISNSYLMSSSSMAVSIVAGFLTFFSKRCRTVRRFGRCTIQPVSYIWLAVASLVNAIWRWGGDTKQLGVQLILVWVFFVSATHN